MDTTEAFRCPRRRESWLGAADGMDQWYLRDGALRCSWCGSLHPDLFMDAVRGGVAMDPTDKNYKIYVGPSSAKFYFQHLPEAQCREFIDLFNRKAVNLGQFGRFTVLPFFMRYGSAPTDGE